MYCIILDRCHQYCVHPLYIKGKKHLMLVFVIVIYYVNKVPEASTQSSTFSSTFSYHVFELIVSRVQRLSDTLGQQDLVS